MTAGDDNTLRVWDTALGTLRASISTGKQAASKATFSPDGSYVLSLGSPAMVWSTEGEFLAMLGQTESHGACFDADGRRLWTTERNIARAWNTRNWQLQDKLSSSFTSPYFVKPLGEDYVLFGDSEGTIELIAPKKPKNDIPR